VQGGCGVVWVGWVAARDRSAAGRPWLHSHVESELAREDSAFHDVMRPRGTIPWASAALEIRKGCAG
jgi:hypothetical protein